jgi:hypothetical protein
VDFEGESGDLTGLMDKTDMESDLGAQADDDLGSRREGFDVIFSPMPSEAIRQAG